MQVTRSLLALISVSACLLGSVNAFKGDATYYDPGLGACGKTNGGGELVVALSTAKYGNGSHCGKYIGIHYKGKYVKAKIVDKCPGCAANDVDISPTTFSRLANQDLGRIQVDWEFL
ncbi:hypothetical protein D9756_007900 [Leucocoprinus leucothites]|uniref:RlpA-like protein double-psi beta-barrel domain-containing protein n=1 Tax=Leucocoprinus leucothites TaxID=201217 RepID=A0A8H5FYI2_9AGAR|nr:hypothetical protein D9756_007900 [Leucoagaricus leucothites]